jgi:O-antigen/teichoic acid export membrane protein
LFINYGLDRTRFGKLNKRNAPSIYCYNIMNWMAQTMMWIMVSLGISIALNFLLGPYLGWLTIIPIIAVFLAMSYFIRRRQMARMGMGGQGGGFGGMLGGGGGGINYICIACGHKFKGGACPRCGSKMRRADF